MLNQTITMLPSTLSPTLSQIAQTSHSSQALFRGKLENIGIPTFDDTGPEEILHQEQFEAMTYELNMRATNLGAGLGYGLGKYVFGTIESDYYPAYSLGEIWTQCLASAKKLVTNTFDTIADYIIGDIDLSSIYQNADPIVMTQQELTGTSGTALITAPTEDTQSLLVEELDSILSTNKKISVSYNDIASKIEIAKREAESKNMPLMILLGEHHYQINSILNEVIVIDIAVKKLGIKKVLAEQCFAERIAAFLKMKNLRFEPSYMQYLWLTEDMIDHFGLEKVVIDLAPCSGILSKENEHHGTRELYPEIPLSLAKTTEGIKIRNAVMTEVAKAYDSDVIAIVGSAHLHGMIKETDLEQVFHILPINVAPYDISPLPRYASVADCLEKQKDSRMASSSHYIPWCYTKFSNEVTQTKELVAERDWSDVSDVHWKNPTLAKLITKIESMPCSRPEPFERCSKR